MSASKAFDRVEYCKLIPLLSIKNVPAAWNGSYSMILRYINGVRLGAVLSPVLFCIYFDKLIHALESAKYGCYIGFCFVGVGLLAVMLTTWFYWRL